MVKAVRGGVFLVGWLLLGEPTTAQDAAEEAAYIRGLSQRGLHDLVVSEASDFLRDHPRSDDATIVRYQLACALYDLDRRDDALPHFRSLAEARGFEYAAESNFRLGQCELDAGRPSAARDALRRVVADDEAAYLHGAAHFLLGEAAMRLEEFGEAESHLARVVEAGGDDALTARASLAWCAYRRDDAARARSRAADVLERRPPSDVAAEMQFLIGEAFLAEGRHAEALPAYAQVRSGAYAVAALRGSGMALAALDRHADAAERFGTVVAKHADSAYASECALRQGIHLVLADEPAAALSALDHPRAPDGAETSYWRGRAEAARGRHPEALQWFERASRQEPDAELTAFLATARGDALVALGRTDEAAGVYASAGSGNATHAAAIASLNAGDAESALALVTPLLKRSGDVDGDVHLTHGEALFALGRHEDAEAAFARAEVTPRSLSRIAWARHLRGDDAAAASAFLRVVRDAKGSPEAVDALYMAGRCFDAIGRGADAVAPWRGYLEAAPGGEHRAEVLFGLARLDTPRADRHLAELASDHPDSPYGPAGVFELAERAVAAGELDTAAARYRVVLDADPELAARARYGLAWTSSSAGRHDDAADHLATLLERRNLDPTLAASACELLIWTHHERGDPRAAQGAWTLLAQRVDDTSRLLDGAFTVSAAWASSESPGEASAFWEGVAQTRAVSTDAAARATAWLEAAWSALDAGDLPLARRRLTSAAKGHPDPGAVAEASFFVGEALSREGDTARALDLYDAAVAVDDWPGRDRALYRRGFVHLESDLPSDAIASFVELAERYPSSELRGESLFLAGESAFRAERYADCVTFSSAMLDDYPRHEVSAKARFRLGLSLAQLERWEDAEATLTTLVRRHPDFEHVLEVELWRGRALGQLGQPRAARAAFQRVVGEDRGALAARAQIGLGQLELVEGNVEDALSSFLKVAVLYDSGDDVAHALLLAGECLESLGQPERAADRYRELIERHGSSPHAAEARARLARR